MSGTRFERVSDSSEEEARVKRLADLIEDAVFRQRFRSCAEFVAGKLDDWQLGAVGRAPQNLLHLHTVGAGQGLLAGSFPARANAEFCPSFSTQRQA